MEEYGQTNSHGGKAIYVIAYFLILAAFMAPAQSLHMGEAAIFYAMVVAGAVLVGIVLGVKLIKRRIEASRLSGRGFTQLMFGITPDLVEGSVEYPDTDALPATSREMIVVGESYDDILPDTIIEENPLRLSDYFQPNIHTILGAMIAICGVRRSGKSNLIAVLAEELGRFSVPMVIFDTEDEYGTLVDRRFLPRSLQVGSEAELADSNSAAQYRVLSADDAYEFGQSILEGRLQVVVNLRSWQDEDAAVIMSEIIDGMNDWEQSKRNEERIPVMVFLDEAQKWLPQNVGDKYVSRVCYEL